MKVSDHGRGWIQIRTLLFGFMMSCAAEATPPVGAVISQDTACNPTPYLTGISLTDLNKNPVSSISPNTSYLIQTCAKVASTCLTLSTGGQLASGSSTSCHDTSFPSPYTPGDVGVTYYGVTTSASGPSLTGYVTPWDSCAGEQPQFNMDFALPGSNSCARTIRQYVCGYALPGYRCDNGRRSVVVDVTDLATAIGICPTVRIAGYTDSCYVQDKTGPAPSDSVQCVAAGGSWRPRNNCCNFRGTLSCPF